MDIPTFCGAAPSAGGSKSRVAPRDGPQGIDICGRAPAKGPAHNRAGGAPGQPSQRRNRTRPHNESGIVAPSIGQRGSDLLPDSAVPLGPTFLRKMAGRHQHGLLGPARRVGGHQWRRHSFPSHLVGSSCRRERHTNTTSLTHKRLPTQALDRPAPSWRRPILLAG